MAHLGSEGHKLRVVLVVEIVEGAHVLGVGDEPVDGGEVLALGQLLVQPPEHLHDAQRGRGHGVREVATRGRHPATRVKGQGSSRAHHTNFTNFLQSFSVLRGLIILFCNYFSHFLHTSGLGSLLFLN